MFKIFLMLLSGNRIFKISLSTVLLFCFVISVNAQSKSDNISKAYQYIKNRNEVYFSFAKRKDITINVFSELISIDKVGVDSLYAYANGDMFAEFLKLNIDFKVKTPPSLTGNYKIARNLTDVLEWDSYPDYNTYLDLMNQFAVDYPSICNIEKIGVSIEGRDILVARISDNAGVDEAEPEFLYTSSMHGDELTSYVLTLRLIYDLLTGYNNNPEITYLVNNMEIWINPLANPDGTYFYGNSTVAGATRFNAAGVDLNRNFPDPENGLHPDGYPWQDENLAMMTFLNSRNFILSANLHTGSELVNFPWDTWEILHADDGWYEDISRQYADTVHAYSIVSGNYFTSEDNGVTNGYAWYSTNGNRQDYVNWFTNSREVTMELSFVKTPSPIQLPLYWESNYRSMYGFIEQCNKGIYGLVTDTINGNPIKAKIEVIGHDFNNSEVYSDESKGYYRRMLSPGIYDIRVTAPGFREKVISSIVLNENSSVEQNVKLHYIPLQIEENNNISGVFNFPNPVFSECKVFFNLRESDKMDIIITDFSGNQIIYLSDNYFNSGLNEVDLNLDPYPSGTYLVLFKSKSCSLSHKILKLH